MYACQVTRYDPRVSAVPSRPRNPRGEGSRLREQLLRATAEVLDEVGDAAAVSVRAIARRAGVSPTALYLQFPDRGALVAAAVDAGFEAFNAALLEAAGSASEPRAQLEAMGRAYLAFSERQPALYAILFSARRPPLDKPLGSERGEGLATLVATVQALDPRLDAAEARELALALWSSLHGFAMLRSVRAHLGWPAAEDYVRRILAAYAPELDEHRQGAGADPSIASPGTAGAGPRAGVGSDPAV
jgi:AcrR family transcriptional regulator